MTLSRAVIGITGLHAGHSPCPGLGVARSLQMSETLRLTLIGLAYSHMESALYYPSLFSQTYILPPVDEESAWLAAFARIRAETGLRVLVPTLDVEQLHVAKRRRYLSKLGLRAVTPDESSLRAREKDQFGVCLRPYGYLYPSTMVVDDERSLSIQLMSISFPCFVKGKQSDAYPCYERDEAWLIGQRIVETWGWPLLLQVMIQGPEYSAAMVASHGSPASPVVVMKKIGLTSKGKTWTGVLVNHELIQRITVEIVRDLTWHGPIEIDYILEENLRPYVIDVNPRFPSWVLAAAMAGCNLAEVCVKLALGRRPPVAGAFRTGLAFCRVSQDIVVESSDFLSKWHEEESLKAPA